MSFKDFKKTLKTQGIDGVSKELDALSSKGEKDDRFWYPKLDEKKKKEKMAVENRVHSHFEDVIFSTSNANVK